MRSFALLLWLPFTAWATPTGISGFSGKSVGTTCTSCHSGGTAPTVMVSGPTTLMLGATGNYTVTVNGGPGKNAGIDAALGGANSGQAVFTAGTGTKLLNGEIVQNAAATMTGGTATFAFSVRAPSTNGVFTLSVAGLSGDGNLSPAGDGVATATVTVTVGTGAATDAGTSPPPVVDAGTPKVDAGVAAPPPTTTSSRDYVAGPVGAGGVDGDVGCSSVGGAPMLIIAAMLMVLWWARRAEPLRIRSRRTDRKP